MAIKFIECTTCTFKTTDPNDAHFDYDGHFTRPRGNNVFETSKAEPLVHAEDPNSTCTSFLSFANSEVIFYCSGSHGTSESRTRQHSAAAVSDDGQDFTITWMKD